MCVCLLMKGSVSFDPDKAKFTQNIDECSGRAENSAELAEKSIL